MRLAFSPTTPGLPAGALVDLCVEADQLGYDAVWAAEVAGPEAFAVLGAAAASTNTVDLGVAVVPAATRSPALLAMGAATLSSLLGGRRLSLGIGASSRVIVEGWHGRDFDPPLARVADAVRATKALLSGERSYSGTTASVERFRLGVEPAGPVAVTVGALGPRMLRLAGAHGDGVCLNLMTTEAVARQLAEIERGAAEAGRSLPDDFEVMARFHVVATDDVPGGRDLVRGAFGPYFGQPVYNRFLRWMGFVDEADSIATAFSAGDRVGVAAAFHDDLVDAVALVGPPEVIRDRLAGYAAAGVGVAALSLIAPSPESVAAGLAELAPSG